MPIWLLEKRRKYQEEQGEEGDNGTAENRYGRDQ
jgi:hypothetical protein